MDKTIAAAIKVLDSNSKKCDDTTPCPFLYKYWCQNGADRGYNYLCQAYDIAISDLERVAECLAAETAPTAVTLSDPSHATTSTLQLDWTSFVGTDFAAYKVYRSVASFTLITGATLVATIENLSDLTFVDGELTSSTIYYYRIAAYLNSGAYALSNQVSGATT